MSTIYLLDKDAKAVEAALYEDVSDPVRAMRTSGVDVSTFFEYGSWRGVDFRISDLDGVSFRGADLRGAIMTKEQIDKIAKSEPKFLPTLVEQSSREGEAEEGTIKKERLREAYVGNSSALPQNIEAEQQIIGSILADNDTYDRVAHIVTAQNFYDPVHARIFELIASRITKNQHVSFATLKPYLEEDQEIAELGGVSYLRKLQEGGAPTAAVRDLAQSVHDLSVRRDLIQHADQVRNMASKVLEGQDAREQIAAAEKELNRLGDVSGRIGDFSSFLHSVTDAVNQANAAYQSDGGVFGIPTGINEMDRRLGGLHNSDLVLLASRPTMGKTALASDIAFFLASNHQKAVRSDGSEGTINGAMVGYVSLDASREQLANRLLGAASEVHSRALMEGELTESEFRRYVEAAKRLEAIPLFIDDTPDLSVSEIAARARRLRRTQGLDFLIVDSIQHISLDEEKGFESQRDLTKIVRDLKVLARDLNIPIVALSELSSNVDDRKDGRPEIGDLREFGPIERYSDVLLLLTRPAYYQKKESKEVDEAESQEFFVYGDTTSERAEMIIAKNRNGPLGAFELTFDTRFGRFQKFNNLPDYKRLQPEMQEFEWERDREVLERYWKSAEDEDNGQDTSGVDKSSDDDIPF